MLFVRRHPSPLSSALLSHVSPAKIQREDSRLLSEWTHRLFETCRKHAATDLTPRARRETSKQAIVKRKLPVQPLVHCQQVFRDDPLS
jgi:hypothetical protein